MRHPGTMGIAKAGVHHVAKIASQANSIFQAVDQENDLGIDGYIEFIVQEAATGCCVGVQIKSGNSYCRPSGWTIPADSAHLRYWRSHSLPVCGVVYNPTTDVARWVDISEFLGTHTLDQNCSIPVPVENRFSVESFAGFREHFLAYRDRYSDDIHFGRVLQSFSDLTSIDNCSSALRALFNFHRNRRETWFYIIASLPVFRGHPLMYGLTAALSHVPGHGDILWHRHNLILESTRSQAMDMLRVHLGRDGIIALLEVIGEEGGIGRGSIGQGVHAIVSSASSYDTILTSIILDESIPQRLRMWAIFMLVVHDQRSDVDVLLRKLEGMLPLFSGEDAEHLGALMEDLRTSRYVDFS